MKIDTTRVDAVAPAGDRPPSEPPPEPFFLSVGFFETHREFFEPTRSATRTRAARPRNLPDTPETRRDMAAFKASARSLDQGVGAVLDALDGAGLADNTLVIFTTDHGLAFPGAKATLYDRGIGVMLIMRGPGGSSAGGSATRWSPTSTSTRRCASWPASTRPTSLQGTSMLPLVRRRRRPSCTTRSSPRAPSTPPTSPSARSAPALEVHPPLRRTAPSRCCPTATTRRARTCC